MKWYHHLACFFAGVFLTNALPHFLHGISGDSFPSPFSHPPGKGLSSPTVNVLWGLANFAIGYLLLRAGGFPQPRKGGLVSFFAGVAFLSIMMSVMFAGRMR